MTSREKYAVTEHTADLGLEIYGRDRQSLFVNACLALFDNIADLSTVAGEHQKTLSVTGVDAPDLLVNWLRELLALWNVDGLLIKSARLLVYSDSELFAEICYDSYVPGRHRLKSEIKAVTYHGLRLEKTECGWVAGVVLDV